MYKAVNLIMILVFSLSIHYSNAQEGLPPLIDREIFFGNPEIIGAQLSPDGKYMSFIKPYNDVRNIWVKMADEPFEAARPVTASEDRPIPGYFWSRDSKYLLYVQDEGGNEDYHVFALDPWADPAEGEDVPSARNITNLEGVRALLYRVPKSDPDLLYVGLNDRDAAWHDLYKVRISTGERELVRENTDQITNWIFDLDDQIRMASRTAADGSTEFMVVDDNEFKVCYSCSVLETCYVSRFHKDGKQVYMVTNKGDELDLTQLTLFDPASQELQVVESDPEGQVDFGGTIFSDVTDELVATTYTGDKTRIYFRDKDWEAEYNWLKEQLPGVEVNIGSSTKDERKFLVYANSDVDPGATYLYDRDKKTLDFQYRPRPKLPVEHLAPMKPVRYASSDGMEIPAYLTLPKGVEAEDLPVIIFPHGGPWARDYWGYNSYAQFLANRGYAVLGPNFRGSTGYGKAFLNAGNKEWGQKMQDDVTYGAKYLIEEGIADPERIGIMGGSYGGYATLAGLTFTPDVYAAGVSIVGPSNLITLLESIPPYWEQIRTMFHERMGDPNTEEGKAELMKRSPLFSADKIRVPLMVVQGANDPRVKKAESDQIVVAMRELGLPVEYICAPDEGHGFARPENNMAFLAAAEKFLAKHLGGRYQEDMPDNIAKRLEEITVDINTVEMPKPVDESKLGGELPKPVEDLSPSSTSYKMTIKMGAQEIPMDVELKVEEVDGNWVISQSANTPMGAMKDVSTLKKGSLMPVSRAVEQGPVKIDLQHSDAKITGTVNMNGNDQPIEVDLEDPVFADGAGLYETLARLPLAEGYRTVYRTFDVQSQKVKSYELTVVGMETVEVPAGSYPSYKAEVKALDDNPGDTTLWLSSEG
ncbi:MAG: prolyl oligopeptidase family serine peptidase, partial [Saprospiraceae bacterium]|nr:prolyl oligopeptidase family serine peptidase [Saprospiraceae bacterium]